MNNLDFTNQIDSLKSKHDIDIYFIAFSFTASFRDKLFLEEEKRH